MIRALLAGHKTQTRRIISPQPDIVGHDSQFRSVAIHQGRQISCPYGQPGDQLWVRERWAFGLPLQKASAFSDEPPIIYAADFKPDHTNGNAWRMSRSMKRSASRITLRIVGIRIQRLRSISPHDACAEGFDAECKITDPVRWFRRVWDELYARRGYGWKTDPWVWVIDFVVLQAGREPSPTAAEGCSTPVQHDL